MRSDSSLTLGRSVNQEMCTHTEMFTYSHTFAPTVVHGIVPLAFKAATAALPHLSVDLAPDRAEDVCCRATGTVHWFLRRGILRERTEQTLDLEQRTFLHFALKCKFKCSKMEKLQVS